MNEYFDIITNVAFKYGGTVDKFIGDCVMVVFGTPYYHGDDEERAVRCALQMLQRIEKLNRERRKLNKPEISIGIGINTGFAIAGNVGTKKRVEYTVVGDTVNVASRIQELAGKGEVLISESTYLEVKDRVEVISLPPVFVKGREEVVSIFRLMNYIRKSEKC